MAAALRAVVWRALRADRVACVSARRSAVSTATGAVMPKPRQTLFGLVRIGLVVAPFMYIGTLISKNFAALLEEHDIFVPEDDDDDD